MNEQILKDTLDEIFRHLNITPKVEIKNEDNVFTINIEGDDLSFLIGKHGRGLEALQSVLGLIVYKNTNSWIVINIDINGYKEQRIEKLKNITQRYVDKMRYLQKEVSMPPMSPWERRQVHIFLAEYDDVEAESFGEGNERHIVLKTK